MQEVQKQVGEMTVPCFEEETDAEKSQTRLQLARSVLWAAETRHGLRSHEEQLQTNEPVSSGIYQVSDETTKIVGSLLPLLSQDFWIAIIEVKNLGWEAFQEIGFNLQRIVKINCVSEKAAETLSILLEGFEVLVIGNLDLGLAQQRTLAAKARKLERIIFTTKPWPFVSKHAGEEDKQIRAVAESAG